MGVVEVFFLAGAILAVLTLAGSEVVTNTYVDGRTGVVVMPGLASQASDPPMQGVHMRLSSSSSARPPRSVIQRPSSSSANTLPLSMVKTSSIGSNSQMVTKNSNRYNQPVFKLLKGKDTISPFKHQNVGIGILDRVCSNLRNVAERMLEYYKGLVEIMATKTRSFSIHTDAGIANTSEAPRKASNGGRIYGGSGFDGDPGWAGGPEVVQYNSGNIIVGAGYSSDSQQIAPHICYNATVSSTAGQQAYVQLNTAISFSDLESQLQMSVDISGKFLMFSAEAGASYLRSAQDKDYSLSLNYYEYATNNVAVQFAGYGEAALTEVGKDFYNGGKNPYFGLLCGDNYITSYQQGALLAMGINIKFSSSVAKQEFEEKAGATFGSIISASERIKNVATQYNITGAVMMQAFQVGGDPSQLSKIFSKDSSGKYYALTCSLTTMDDCVLAASGLLDYAKESFSTQFSFQNNTGLGLTPLGIAFSQFN
ncbi:uncharacterized protein LOC108673369 [Hyalella azteca]|uniref:Uncharacterized protein LOC108673369 n=1 Tax=Hyalella azteca TaxID=294128 RepID=A0A8B7NSE8_HYAAZ|nr:uncharacterized protein LOC108673369 [Hyalella azteca]